MFASLLRRSLAALAAAALPFADRGGAAPRAAVALDGRAEEPRRPALGRERAIEHPTAWRPWRWTNGKWRGPELSRREQAHRAKEAIRRGEVKLEPTVMVPPPKFKGHKRAVKAEQTRAIVAQKMEQMPELIAEYRAARRERRAKIKGGNRWK